MLMDDSLAQPSSVKGVAPSNVEEGVEAYPVSSTSGASSEGTGPNQGLHEVAEDLAIGPTGAEPLSKNKATIFKEAVGKDLNVLPVVPLLQLFIKRV